MYLLEPMWAPSETFSWLSKAVQSCLWACDRNAWIWWSRQLPLKKTDATASDPARHARKTRPDSKDKKAIRHWILFFQKQEQKEHSRSRKLIFISISLLKFTLSGMIISKLFEIKYFFNWNTSQKAAVQLLEFLENKTGAECIADSRHEAICKEIRQKADIRFNLYVSMHLAFNFSKSPQPLFWMSVFTTYVIYGYKPR